MIISFSIFLSFYCASLLQTLEIMNSAYQFEWYKCDVNIQKSLIMMIRRTQNTTGIEVPFFETNLSTFMSVS